MKLFWKFFFTAMLLSTLCVAWSGYLLIRSSVAAQLDGEAETAVAYGEIVYYSLLSQVRELDDPRLSAEDAGAEPVEQAVAQLARSISIDSMNQKVPFGVADGAGQTLFSSLPVALDRSGGPSSAGEQGVWRVREASGAVYVQSLRPAVYLGRPFTIETVRDVTYIFQARQSQYELLWKLLAGMVCLAGALTFVISKLLSRRIVALTRSTNRIAQGDFSARASEGGRDEIAQLSEHFNQMAARLEAMVGELKEEARRKELFVGAFSHECKTPLTSIIGYADLLRSRALTPEQRTVCAGYIFQEGRRLERLSMRLLELIVLKQRRLDRAPEEMVPLLDEAAATARPMLEQSGVALDYRSQPGLVCLEAALMKTVVLNLLDNARKAMEGGGTVTLRGERRGGDYAVEVRDAGKGIAPEDLNRITGAFYMADKSRARAQGGAGLGLALCDEIVKLHGFTLSFASQVGVGTTATVTMRREGA